MRILIDIDSTIWAAEKEYEKVCQQLYGVPFGLNWYSEEDLEGKFGPEYTQIFDKALAPEKVMSRRLYPGAIHALTLLHSYGHTLHFITHNKNEYMHKPLWNWLKVLFPRMNERLALTVMHPRHSKVDFMYRCEERGKGPVWGIIEDKPQTILEAHASCYEVLIKEQPWNLTICHDYDIMSFNRWEIVPTLVGINMARQKELV